MSDVTVIQLMHNALLLVLQITTPILGLSLIAGVGISVLQAATQVQEQTLSFVPKLIALIGALMAFGPWILRILLSFTSNLLIDLPNYIQ